MKSLITLLTILSSISAYAGSANALISCKSDSGRTQLNASVPGDHAEHNVKFSIDGISLDWYSEVNQRTYQTEENSTAHVLGSLKDKNYHFIIVNTDGYKTLTFSAIPSSVKLKQTEYGETATLKAIVYGNDPRENEELSPKITVNCDYSYEI